jgi:hypothetical protein
LMRNSLFHIQCLTLWMHKFLNTTIKAPPAIWFATSSMLDRIVFHASWTFSGIITNCPHALEKDDPRK